MLGDLKLVKLAKDGSLEAFEALISKYKDRVYMIEIGRASCRERV